MALCDGCWVYISTVTDDFLSQTGTHPHAILHTSVFICVTAVKVSHLSICSEDNKRGENCGRSTSGRESVVVEAVALLVMGTASNFSRALHPKSHFYGAVY